LAEPDTLQSLLRHIVSFGDAPAVIAFSGEHADTLSFAALGETARALAHALAQRGVQRGDMVAIIAPNSPNWIIAYWSIIAAGAVAVPIDAQIADADAARMLATAGCRVVFTTAARAPLLPQSVAAIALDSPPPQAQESGPLPEAAAEDVAVLLFTSGTTGTPKPVPLTHANILSNVRAIGATGLVEPSDRALLPLPLHHAYPLTVGMTTGLANGVAIILPAGVSGPELVAALARGRASVLLGVPRLYTALVAGIRTQLGARGGLVARLFPRLLRLSLALRPILGARVGRIMFGALRRAFAPELRLLVSGGAALDRPVEDTLSGLGWEVMTGYGLTETSPILSFNRPGAARSGTAGRALPGVSLRIVRPDETGVGEIEAKGASVFAGYRGEAAATRAAFTEDGWFRTGDFGRIDADFYLHIVARVSETIVLADGKKLFPEDVEAVYAAHPLIKEVALLAVNGALVALVLPDFEAVRAAGAVRLRDLIRDALAERGRSLPSHARLTGFAIARDRLPRTQLGKIRRHLLPALYARASEERTPAGPAELSPEDRALLEDATAAAAWAWIKRRFAGRSLDLDTSPQLDLGIESLGWVDLTLALERDLGVSLHEAEIARIVSLRDLVREIVAAKARPESPPAPAPEVVLARLGPIERVLRLLCEAAARGFMRIGFRLRVRGREHLPARGPFLLCPNHESYLDPVAVAAALPHAILRETWWAGWTGILFTTRVRRLFSRVMQVVPVDVDRTAGAGLAVGGAVLARGQVMAWFPEGALSPDGTLQRFLPGVGVLAKQRPVPIVPVLIEGSFECWPLGQSFPPRFGRVAVTFLPPLDPAPFVGMEPQAIADQVRRVVAAAEEPTK
jgi:long-chain acyl-CoA synthetase